MSEKDHNEPQRVSDADSAAVPEEVAPTTGASSATPVGEDETSYTAAMEILDEALISGTLAARLRQRLAKHGQETRNDTELASESGRVPTDAAPAESATPEDSLLAGEPTSTAGSRATTDTARGHLHWKPASLPAASTAATGAPLGFSELISGAAAGKTAASASHTEVESTASATDAPLKGATASSSFDEVIADDPGKSEHPAEGKNRLAAWFMRMKNSFTGHAGAAEDAAEASKLDAQTDSTNDPDFSAEPGTDVPAPVISVTAASSTSTSDATSPASPIAPASATSPASPVETAQLTPAATSVSGAAFAPASVPLAVEGDQEPASRIVAAGQRAHLTFTRQGGPVLKLDQGTRAISNSLRSVRSTIDTLNAGERIDPTRPTIAIFAAVTVVVGCLAGFTLIESSPDWSFSRTRPVATAAATPTATATSTPTQSANPAAVVPQIASIEVISFDNDGGDHPDWAGYMLDNNASTMWQSRYFDRSELPEGNTIRLIVHLKESVPVSKVILTGPVEGGQVDLRVNDGNDPFGSQVLTSAKMGATTTLTPSKATEGNTVTLDFFALPTDDEGRHRVKISELQVK